MISNGVRKTVTTLGLIVALSVFAWPPSAFAHSELPARLADVRAGPYPLTVGLYADPVHAGAALSFTIDPVRGFDVPPTFLVTAVPAEGVDATPVRGHVEPHPDVAGGSQGEVNLPVAGNWLLQITVDGPAGRGTAMVPVVAVPPPAIPFWLGWLIGLLPVYGFAGFVVAQSARRPRTSGSAAW